MTGSMVATRYLPPPVVHARLTVRIGCRLIFRTAVPTPVLLHLQPLAENGQVVVDEHVSVGESLELEPVVRRDYVQGLRCTLPPGTTEIRHDALVDVPNVPDRQGIEEASALAPEHWPPELFHYALPSRFCESDRLADFAWATFGHLPPGWPRLRAVSDWVHRNIEYRFGSGAPDLSAWEVFQRRYGVCRDFAHLTIALCRALNLPARYASGHLPDIGFQDPGTPMDFHAYAEVMLGGRWFPVDARYNVPRIGRIKICHGVDAAECAFSTAYGRVELLHFEVWAYQIEPGTVELGDPVDLSKRLDGTVETRLRLQA
jgi:transglutaminase-like putative cysteine protease